MAEFLTTVGNSYGIEKIIIKSEMILTIVTPFLKLSNTLVERMIDADKRNVKIVLIYGKDELNRKEKKNLHKLKNIKVYFYKNLHAKCYYNENEMIITSMNLYEFSERNNREMGILIDRRKDRQIYKDAIEEVNSILNTAKIDNNLTNLETNEEITTTNPFLLQLEKRIREKYNKFEIVLLEDELTIEDFPCEDLKINVRSKAAVINLHFSDEDRYDRANRKFSKKLDYKLSDKRVFWNYLKIAVYQESGYKVENSENGLIEAIERSMYVIDVFYKVFRWFGN